MRRLIGLILLLVVGFIGCSSERPTEPEKMQKNPFSKDGRMKKVKP
jgi:hypothetical protein